MTFSKVVVTAAQERRHAQARPYVLALLALARQLQDDEAEMAGQVAAEDGSGTAGAVARD